MNHQGNVQSMAKNTDLAGLCATALLNVIEN